MADLVMKLANVSREVAEEALVKHKEVWLAVDVLIDCPVVAGNKFIPQKPLVITGHTSEQEARCQKGRWLQDQINAVFSVAHSKTQAPHSEEVLEDESERSLSLEVETVSVGVRSDSHEQTIPLVHRSDSLP